MKWVNCFNFSSWELTSKTERWEVKIKRELWNQVYRRWWRSVANGQWALSLTKTDDVSQEGNQGYEASTRRCLWYWLNCCHGEWVKRLRESSLKIRGRDWKSLKSKWYLKGSSWRGRRERRDRGKNWDD